MSTRNIRVWLGIEDALLNLLGVEEIVGIGKNRESSQYDHIHTSRDNFTIVSIYLEI